MKPSSLSALVAAEAVARGSKISVLLGGSGPALHRAADHAASSHPLVSEVLCRCNACSPILPSLCRNHVILMPISSLQPTPPEGEVR